MNIIYLLIILSLLLVVVILGIFFWAIRSGQYDDLDKHGYDILMDEEDTDSKVRSKPGSSEQYRGNDSDVNADREPEKR